MDGNNFLEDLKRNRGCGFGLENRAMIEGTNIQIDDMKTYFNEYRRKLEWLIYLIIALSFMVGGDIVSKLIPLIIHR